MSEHLPLRQFDASDPKALRAWLADARARAGTDEAFDEHIAAVIGQLGREYQRVAAALLAKGRGQRQGGTEVVGREQAALWAKKAEERAAQDGEPTTYTEPDPEETAPADPPKRGHRAAFPSAWPRQRVELPVAADLSHCTVCGKGKVCIGHDLSEVLAVEPAKLYVKEFAREKLACPDACDGVVTAAPGLRLVERSACDLSINLDLLDRKLIQHQPIYRIQQVYERLGCSIDDSTLNRWFHDGLRAVESVARVCRRLATAADRYLLNIDDTTVPVMDHENGGGAIVGHIWIVVGDGRFVSATASRDWTKEHPQALVGTWTGYVQADAYKGFDGIFTRSKDTIEVGCWAHARRYFIKARDRGDRVAEEAIGLISRLYKVEKDARELDPVARLALRQERSRPTLDLLWRWFDRVRRDQRVRPTSPLGKAFRYLTNQRTALERFLEDGRLHLDNTVVEREMRPIVLGRKNWLFAGSFGAAERLSHGITVVATARMHDVDPVAYLNWLLPQLARREWSDEEIERSLLPASFKQSLEKRAE